MNSIQRRLSISLTIGIALLWMLATLISGLTISHELNEAFDSELQETAQLLLSIAALEFEGSDEIDDLQALRSAREREHDELLSYLIKDRRERTVLLSHDADLKIFPDDAFEGFRTTSTHRFYSERAIGNGLSIQIADPLSHRKEALVGTLLALAIPLLLLVPLSLALVWLIVRHSMHSVQEVRLQIESRGDINLEPIATENIPRELSPIARSVNDLLDRLKRALESERNFATNSAHELRTPIASALSQTQLQITALPPGTEKARARKIEQSLHSLARLSEKLMQLARAESGFLVHENPQDSFQIIKHVISEFQQAGTGTSRIHLQSKSGEQFLTRLDPDGFAILMRNLIENALKHGSPDTPVDIIVDGAHNKLHVINSCPVIKPEKLDNLRTRFQRGDTSASGAGLGLAIVDAITQRAGIRLKILSPATGREDGFETIMVSDA